MIKLPDIRLLGLCFWLCIIQVEAQPKKLSIEESYQLARKNYPVIRQRELISKAKDYSIQNAEKGYLPQISVLGQATYQSAVTEFRLPVSLPGVEFPTISKDQYKVYAEVNQSIYDGGAIRTQMQMHEMNAVVEDEKLEVELYKLNERINQIFFGILMLDEQIKQNALLKNDIELGISKIQALISNGTAFKSNGYTLQAELLKTEQRTTELESNRRAYLDMLGLFINENLDDATVIVKPAASAVPAQINRPELRLYDYQTQSLDIQNRLLNVRNKPKLNFFFQGGAGRPALNILNNGFNPYYITGIRLNWALSGLYTLKNDRALIANNRQSIQVQRGTFLYNTNLILKQQNTDVTRLQKLLATDDDIIALRDNIKTTAAAQLENGVINTNDYLREVNAGDQARLSKIVHEIQLLTSQFNLQTTLGRSLE
ncbi:TolC family protein [Dyadobacter bucti]|uniref:TolC family protein n=1 Tax=Dyadobacter bucti TaxID=2572203 RepID=UPI003F710FEA